jgi:hypothetical protein
MNKANFLLFHLSVRLPTLCPMDLAQLKVRCAMSAAVIPSAGCLLCPDERTSSGRLGMSEKCQKATSFNHLVGTPNQRIGTLRPSTVCFFKALKLLSSPK